MSIAFNCPQCGGRIQVSWLAPGQLAHCRECGEQVVVPKESEPPRIRDKADQWQSTQDEPPSWKGLILGGLVPSAFLCLAVVPFFAVLLIVVAPLLANPLLGVIVGRSVSRLRFVCGMGVAMGGWILSGVVGALILEQIIPLVAGAQPKGSETGLGMFLGLYVMFGLVASPIAGIASAMAHSRET